jgi:hypothetical protein
MRGRDLDSDDDLRGSEMDTLGVRRWAVALKAALDVGEEVKHIGTLLVLYRYYIGTIGA